MWSKYQNITTFFSVFPRMMEIYECYKNQELIILLEQGNHPTDVEWRVSERDQHLTILLGFFWFERGILRMVEIKEMLHT